MIEMRKRRKLFNYIFIVISLVIFLFPSECRADGVEPLLNFFSKETYPSATIVTLVIIFLEAGLLKWRIREVKFKIHLWRSTIINVASSAVGSIVIKFLFFRNHFFVWESFSLILPLFIITLITEIPLLKKLYNFSWGRSIKLGLGINIASYIAVILIEIGLLFVSFGYAGHMDDKAVKEWSDETIFQNEAGKIYTDDNGGLAKFDVSSQKWELFNKNISGLNSGNWDVESNILALANFQQTEFERVEIYSLSSQKHLKDLTLKARTLKISPDLKKIAIFEYISEASLPKNAEGYIWIGTIGKLKVFDIESGKFISESPMMAVDEGMCWSLDSKSVIFVSFLNKKVLDFEAKTNAGSGAPYTDYIKSHPFYLVKFNIENHEVEKLTKGFDPVLVRNTGDISFLNGRELYNYTLSTGKISIRMRGLENYPRKHAISPDGKKLLIDIPHYAPLSGGLYLVAVDIENLDLEKNKKCILQIDSRNNFKWTL